MIEITNKDRNPVQLIIRKKNDLHSFSTKNLAGFGAGKNVYFLEDERTTSYIDKLEKQKLIVTRYIPNREYNKGE